MDGDQPAESNRYDGAPAPPRNTGVTLGDAKAAVEEARENATCDHCGDDDYEDLKQVPSSYDHECSAHQNQLSDPLRLCSDCREDHSPKEDFLDDLRESENVTVLYECGFARSPERPDTPEDIPADHPQVDSRGRIPAECLCGAEIEDVFY